MKVPHKPQFIIFCNKYSCFYLLIFSVCALRHFVLPLVFKLQLSTLSISCVKAPETFEIFVRIEAHQYSVLQVLIFKTLRIQCLQLRQMHGSKFKPYHIFCIIVSGQDLLVYVPTPTLLYRYLTIPGVWVVTKGKAKCSRECVSQLVQGFSFFLCFGLI